MSSSQLTNSYCSEGQVYHQPAKLNVPHTHSTQNLMVNIEGLQAIFRDGYGSIPMCIPFVRGMNIHNNQQFDVNRRGTRFF